MTITDNNTPAFSAELTMPQIEAVVKTLGIAISNLMGKSSRVSGALRDVVNSEMNTLIEVQQIMLGMVTDSNNGGG